MEVERNSTSIRGQPAVALGREPPSSSSGSADFPVCRVASFPACRAREPSRRCAWRRDQRVWKVATQQLGNLYSFSVAPGGRALPSPPVVGPDRWAGRSIRTGGTPVPPIAPCHTDSTRQQLALGQGLAVRLDLADGLDDLVHVAALGRAACSASSPRWSRRPAGCPSAPGSCRDRP